MGKQEQVANMAAVIYAAGGKTIREAIIAAEDIALAVQQRAEELDAWVNPPGYDAMQDALQDDRRDDPAWNLDACTLRLGLYETPAGSIRETPRDFTDFTPDCKCMDCMLGDPCGTPSPIGIVREGASLPFGDC